MSDAENFLSRWSRLKRDESADDDSGTGLERKESRPAHIAETPEAAALDVPPFDPATLPPIETIGADPSDIRAFLAPGVPADMKRAALRRAWSSDPSIRDFIGLSENSWDFNAPETIFGFGSIEKEKIQELLERVLGSPDTSAAAAEARDQPPEGRARPRNETEPAQIKEQQTVTAASADGLTDHLNAVPVSTSDGEISAHAVHGMEISQYDIRLDSQNGLAHLPERANTRPSRRHGGALPE